MGTLGPNKQEEEDNDTLCAALLKTKMAHDEGNAQLVMASHQLLASRNYKVMFSLGDKGRWISTSAILDTVTGPNFIEQ